MHNMDNVIIGEDVSMLTAMRILKLDPHWGPKEYMEDFIAQAQHHPNGYPYQVLKDLEMYGVNVWIWEQYHFHTYTFQIDGKDTDLTLVKIWNNDGVQILHGKTVLCIVTLNKEKGRGQIDCLWARGVATYQKEKQILALILPAS